MSDVSYLPAWRNAVAVLFGGKFTYGQIVSHEELLAAFDLPKPTGKITAEEYEHWRLAVLSQQEALSEWLLEERNMLLVSVPGQGYLIMEPEKQSEHALARGMKRVRREVKRMIRQLHYVDRSALTHEQARENADALARAAWIRQQIDRGGRMRIADEQKQNKEIEG